MPRPERVLYASFLRLLRSYRCERIPLTGVVGSGIVVADGRHLDSLKRLFRQPQEWSIESGLRLLSVLQSQLETLVSSEEETREALAEWEQLVAGRAEHSAAGQPAAAAAVAAERGMRLLVKQAARLDELFAGLQLHDGGGSGGGGSGGDAAPREEDGVQPATLESLAAEVEERYMQLAAVPGAAVGLLPPAAAAVGRSPEPTLLKAAALSEVLYVRHKYCHRPFEWVYDGLKPLLLPEVLARRRGLPLSLAILAAAVGRRAGLALMPLPAAPFPSQGFPAAGGGGSLGPGGDGTAAAAAALDQLPQHLASKLSSSAQGSLPPVQPPWLLRIEGTSGGQEGAACHMDAATGQILGPQEASGMYPSLLQSSPSLLDSSSGLVVWQSLVRTILQAHQRRGESDLVANWMYVLLALDPQAEEWGFMLQHGAS